jgi:hypothetical protein
MVYLQGLRLGERDAAEQEGYHKDPQRDDATDASDAQCSTDGWEAALHARFLVRGIIFPCDCSAVTVSRIGEIMLPT